MDAIQPVGAPTAPAPVATPDMRPTADAAALASDPQPDTPMPFPASLGQQAEVNQSRLSPEDAIGEVEKVERVLKPYGVSMLPHDPGETAQSEADQAPQNDEREPEG